MTVTISTFYKFVRLDDCDGMRERILALCEAHAIKGTILLAREGINATISGAEEDIGTVLAWLRADPRFTDLVCKGSYASAQPFQRLKVKIKSEIITFGVPEADPSRRPGT